MLDDARLEFAPDLSGSSEGAETVTVSNGKRAFDTYQVVNHSAFGRKVAHWSRHPEARPRTVAELRQQAGGDIYLLSSLQSIEFAQGDETRLMIYLPPVYKLDEAEARLARAKASGTASAQSYPLPDFYAAILSGALTDVEEILYSRIGDYSVAGCK
jgi:hypothetical protein